MIKLKNISKSYKNFHLEIEDLIFYRGLTIVIGHNGAGKSTLLNILSTTLMPDEGEIIYFDKSMDKNMPLIRSEIGFLPTGLELYGDITVINLIYYLGRLKGMSEIDIREGVNKLLKLFKVERVKNNKIKYLSQGTRQLVGILQSFINEPFFLFLDEPLNNLDIEERNHIISLVKMYANNHIVILATHELEVWKDYADNILCLKEGKVKF